VIEPHRPAVMRIRGIEIRPAVILAPMEGLTDVIFRRLIRRIGGLGLTCTEFVPAEGLIRRVKRVRDIAALDPDERPAAVQIYGRRPEALAEAARMVAGGGAAVVDINMGCPARKVCAHSGGAALLGDPALVRAVVAAVRAAVSLPVTVKIRSGLTRALRNHVEIARICEGEGADAIVVHWRTREEAFGGTFDPGPIAEVRAAVRIPVVGNGDVVDVPTAFRLLDATGCHALMIGRGALKNPWLPLEVARALSGDPFVPPSTPERGAFLLAYIEGVREVFRTETGALGRVKKLSAYFTRGMAGGGDLRRRILHARTLDEVIGTVQAWVEAGGTDSRTPCPW
jgi:tRNA-dihydrouridine synthase B